MAALRATVAKTSVWTSEPARVCPICDALGRAAQRAVVSGVVDVGQRALRDLRYDTTRASGTDAENAIAVVLDTFRQTIEHGGSDGSGDGELGIECGDGQRVLWLLSEHALIGTSDRLQRTAPFVALVGGADDFTRSHRDLVRVGLAIETHAPTPRHPAPSPLPSTAATAQEIVHRLSLGMVVVDCAFNVALMNAAAREVLQRLDDPRVVDGRFLSDDARLDEAVRAAASGRFPYPRAVALGGRSTEACHAAVTIAAVEPGSALVVFGEDNSVADGVDVLLEELGLTPAERRVARPLLRGQRLAAAAAEAGVTHATAHGYLKRIFEKTGTHSQSGFVALVHALKAPLHLAVGSSATIGRSCPRDGWAASRAAAHAKGRSP